MSIVAESSNFASCTTFTLSCVRLAARHVLSVVVRPFLVLPPRTDWNLSFDPCGCTCELSADDMVNSIMDKHAAPLFHQDSNTEHHEKEDSNNSVVQEADLSDPATHKIMWEVMVS